MDLIIAVGIYGVSITVALVIGAGLAGWSIPADVATWCVSAMAALGPIGVAVVLHESATSTLYPWDLRADRPKKRVAAPVAIIGFGVAACAAGASMLFQALARAPGWWTVGDLIRIASWSDTAALPARWALALPCVAAGALVALSLFERRELHGSAKWATWGDAAKSLLDGPRGIVLGAFMGRLLIYAGQGHVLGIAPSRSGKGVGWIIPTLLTWPGSVLVLDPKRENWLHASGWRAKAWRQPQYTFDPFAETTARWNPLAYVQACTEDPADEIDRIARIMYLDTGKGETHWIEGARGAFRGTLAHLWAEAPDALTLGYVAWWTAEHLSNESTLSALAETSQSESAQIEFRKLLNTPAKERGSFLSTLGVGLSPFLLPTVDRATSANDFDLRTLRKAPMSIYFFVSPDNAQRIAVLQRIWWQQVIDTLTRKLPGPDEPWPVLLLMDEFTMPGPMPLVVDSAGFAAGYGIKIFTIVQSWHQLHATYDAPRAKAFLDTMAVRAYYAPNDIESAQKISDELGTTTTRAVSRSRRSGEMAGTRSESQQKRPLLLPQEVMQLGQNKGLITVENGKPVKTSKVRFFKHPRFKHKAALPPVTTSAPANTVRLSGALSPMMQAVNAACTALLDALFGQRGNAHAILKEIIDDHRR